jgi:hypothetical protein
LFRLQQNLVVILLQLNRRNGMIAVRRPDFLAATDGAKI